MLAFADARAHRFPGPHGNRPVNWIGAGADGALLWNGHRVAGESVRNYLAIVAAMRPRPATVVQRLPGAPCAAAAAAAAMVEAAFPCERDMCVITAGEAFVPPTPPAPPVPPRLVEFARLRHILNDYFGADDYPAAALRGREEGVVAFRLEVGPQGRVTRCTITGSSGSASLDVATCRILTARARFTPARNSSNEPTSDFFSSRVTWRLPPPLPPVPPEGANRR